MEDQGIGNYSNIDKAENSEIKHLLHTMDYLSNMGIVKLGRNQAIEYLRIPHEAEVLNLGCGMGDVSRLLLENNPLIKTVIGVDYSEAMLAEANKRKQFANEQYQFGDAHNLDFPENYFEAIFCERVLHHLQTPQQALAECYRILKSGCRAVFFDPALHYMALQPAPLELSRSIADFCYEQVQHGDIGLDLPNLCHQAGFKIISYDAKMHIWNDFNALDNVVKVSKVIKEYDNNQKSTCFADIIEANESKRFVAAIPIYCICVEKP